MRVEVYGKPVEEEGRQYFLNLAMDKAISENLYPHERSWKISTE